MTRNFLSLWTFAGALALALISCGPKELAGSSDAPGDVSVAVVDGRDVWVSDVKAEAVAEGLIAPGDRFDPASDVFRRTLEEVIDQRLLAAEAVRQGLDKSPEAQKRLAAARDRVLGGLLTNKVVEAAISEEQIQRLYGETANAARASPEMRVSQIIVATQGEAQAIRAAIEAGGSFETLALDRSIDSGTRFRGGDLGGSVTLDILPAEYGDALRAAAPGQVVGPVAAPGGFAVLKLVERRQEAPVELNSARPLIVRFLTYDQVKDLIENLRGKAKVELKLPAASAAPAAQAPATAPAAAAPAISATPSSTRPGMSVDGTPAAR